MDEEKEDRISSLPDGLLLEIISLIKIKERYVEEERITTTREVIKTTSTISKRWQHLWTKLPSLIFIDGCYGERQPGYFSFINKTLTQCPTNVNLNKFKLHIYYDSRVDTQPTSQINSWIRYVITRNVQEFNFYFWDFGHVIRGVPKEFTFDDELFFNNSCFTRMKLFCCVFNPPNGAIRWDNLKYLCISKGKLDDDSLGKMLSESPCLETLELEDCYGIRQIDFTSKRFKNLVLSNYSPSLVKADLDYLGSRHFAKKLGRTRDDIEEELLRGLLPSFGHVLSSLKDKGFQLFTVGVDADEDRITELIASAEKKLDSFRFGGAPAENFLENVEYDDVRHGIQSIRLRDNGCRL
nr:hypothetical protein [Tanacetum cinerariifolium]